MSNPWFKVPALSSVLACVAACGGGGSGPIGPTVTIAYAAPTALDPTIPVNFPGCYNEVRDTHIHPSWLGFGRRNMEAVGADLWIIDLVDVPADRRLSFRINDANECVNHPTGAVTTSITANGIILTTVVGTPGNGVEPGLSFIVDAEGNVTP